MTLALLILQLCFLKPAFASDTVSGNLLERGTKKKLSNVNIFILPHKLKTTSDSNGSFQFENVPPGPFQIIVNNIGYIRLEKEIKNSDKNLTLYLEKESYDIFETTVTGLAERRDVSQKTLTQNSFLKTPGAQEDPIKAIQNLPGIANQSISSQVVIQGSEPDDTRYTLNGHEIPLVFHFGGLSSIIMPQAVEQVEFLASGYGPEYGRALGGIINLKTRPPKKDRWHGLAFVDLYNAGGLIEGPIDDKNSIFLSTRYSYIGQVLKTVAQDNENFNFTVAPTFTDLFFDYNYKASAAHNFSMIYIRSTDNLKFVLSQPLEQDPSFRGAFFQETFFQRVIPRWDYKISATSQFHFSIGFGDNDITFEAGNNFFKLDSQTLSIRSEFEQKFNDNYTSYWGIDSQQTKLNVKLKFPQSSNDPQSPPGEVRFADIDQERWLNGFYWRNRLNFFDDLWVLSPNLRIGHFSQTEEVKVMPRLSLVYNLSPSLSLNFASGLYFQGPQNGEAAPQFGNPELKLEQAIHYSLGLEKDFRSGSSNGLILSSEIFYKTLSNLIIDSPKTNIDGSPLVYSNDGEGDVIGLQSQLKWKYYDWNLVAAYTFLQSNRREPNKSEFPSEFDQTHNLNLIASYDYKKWTFSTRLRYVTGRPYTPFLGGIFDSDNDIYIPVSGTFFSKRFDSFFQWDLRVDRKWVFNQWIFSTYLDLQNVTNRGNVEALNYNYDYSDSQATMGLPLLPIFGLKGEF